MEEETKAFEKYLLSEYENIAQAHFKSTETISAFFRYYLLIMSLPLSALAILGQQLFDHTKRYQLEAFLVDNRVSVFSILTIVALIGTGLFCYVINLRFDSILYARTVNSIRKYHFDRSGIDLNLKLRFRVLPQSKFLPPYYEKKMFWPVISVFGLINSVYLILGLGALSSNVFKYQGMSSLEGKNALYAMTHKISENWIILAIAGLFFLAHFIIYYRGALWREAKYLRSNIIGIDIDGVLNEHRGHFCEFLKKHSKEDLAPSDIMVMPVHEDGRKNIDRRVAEGVFNDPSYWTEMPVVEGDVETVFRELKNTYGYKLFLFTHRSWPKSSDKRKKKELLRGFYAACTQVNIFDRLMLWIGLSKFSLIKKITVEWLKKHRLDYDRLYLETGNEYSGSRRGRYQNRLWLSRKKNIRYFVEDDLEKAIKLSFICDIVFLVSHPYNSPNDKLSEDVNLFRKNIPENIVRVDDWNEILRLIRRFA